MKFKGQGKINICGFEYKKNIADSHRGGFRAPKKKSCIRACQATLKSPWMKKMKLSGISAPPSPTKRSSLSLCIFYMSTLPSPVGQRWPKSGTSTARFTHLINAEFRRKPDVGEPLGILMQGEARYFLIFISLVTVTIHSESQ